MARPGVGWCDSRRLGRTESRHVPEGRTRHPLPPGEGWGEGARFTPRDRCHGKVHGERNVFQELDTHGDHEPWCEASSERPSSRPSPGGRRRIFPAGVGGWRRGLAGASRDGSDGWSSGMSLSGICGSLSLRERVGVREPVSTLAIAAIERFVESPLFKINLLTGHEPRRDEWSGRPSSRPSPGGRRRTFPAGF
jgi:hypothetical protein